MDFYRFVTDDERTIEAAWQHKLRDSVLKGHTPLQNIPRLLATSARVYLSSVATDSECERRYLMDNVYIKLREYCRAAHGIEFQVVDLRSGVDRQSQHVLPSITHIRKFEIQQCQNTSSGPCFLALLGQRYCNEAIPPTNIAQDTFTAQKDALKLKNHDVNLLEKYYKLDENRNPPCYLLQPNLLDINKWVETERRISELLMLSAEYLEDADWSNPPSDLQEEVNSGLFGVTKQKFRDDNCLLMKRNITDIGKCLERKRASKFIDIYPGTNQVDKEANQALADLNTAAQSYLTDTNIFNFDVDWSEPAGIDSKAHKEYLTSLGNTVFEQIRRHVDICMIEWGHYPDDELYIDVQQHWLSTKTNLVHFYEQGQHIQALNGYVSSQSRSPLIVHGVSGCGKSAILSNIASNACDKSSSLRVILRHLGYTPASSDIEQLLHSLIKQLCEVMGMVYTHPKTFLEAKVMFRNILETGYCNCTLLLVMDGLDRLSTGGYDQIDWLPLKLSPNIKMIVSTRDSDPRNTLEQLRSRYADSSSFLKVENMLPEICEWILDKKMKEINRKVTDKQWNKISKSLHESPYPLYLELTFQQISRWRSFDFPYIPDTVPALIERLLNILESRHGHLVTSHILSLITCSKYGLSEAELEDILSIDDELLSLFSTPDTLHLSVQRVPCLVWSRLKLDLHPYLAVWKVDGINLITWRYSQISEAVSAMYLEKETFSKKIHSLVADFFTGIWSGINKKPNALTPQTRQQKTISSVLSELSVPESSHRNVISQPLIISGHGTNARINVRKLNELAHHLAKSERIEELREKVLFNYHWLHTKLSVMPMARLLSDFDLYTDVEISLVRQALDDIKTEFDPDILGIELTGRLMSYYSEHPNIKKLIDQCDLEAMRRCSAVPKLQLYKSPGSFLQHEFEGCVNVGPTLQLTTISKADATYFVLKHNKWSYALLRNVESYEETRLTKLPGEGLIYITPNQEKLIAKRGMYLESFQIDSHLREFTVPTENGPINCSAISDVYFIFSIKQKTGPFVVDLKNPSLVQTFNHHSTAIGISDDSEIMVCNDGQSLHVYELPLMTRHCIISTDDTASKVLFLSDPDKFVILSSSHYVRLYSISRRKKTSTSDVILQEPSTQDILLSPDKAQLLVHSRKYVKLFDLADLSCQHTISELSHSASSHDFVSAAFNSDGSRIVAARERSIGVFDSRSGQVICHAEVPFPCDIWSCVTCPKMNKVVSVLDNGFMHVWDIGLAGSPTKHKANYYPGEVTSFSVSHDGSKMAVCNAGYPDAKVIDCRNGDVEHRLYDSFAAGSQPLSVEISPCGTYVVTRCSNDIEGTISWSRLRSDYVWSLSASRVTHFFINCYSVTFSSDDEVVVALSCVDFSPADPSNKFFTALCYKLKGEDADEHKVTLPDGDLIGEPLVYSKKKWLVCLVQPCIKTKFSGMVMEQRVDNVQLYVFDIFTSSARDRRAINCFDLIEEEKTYFINMREMTTEYQLLFIYSRGKLPPYKDDCTVDAGYPMSKGLILFDLLSSTVLHHIPSYASPTVPADRLLVSKYLTYMQHDYQMYDGKTGKQRNHLNLKFKPSDTISPVLLLDGNYMAVITDCHSVVRVINSRNGVERSHFMLHGEAIDIKVGHDDRTLYTSTMDGRVLVMVIILELCDPVTMLVKNLPTRKPVK